MFSPYAERTKRGLLEELRSVLPACGLVIEIGSGSGQHVAHFAAELPVLRWLPTDRDTAAVHAITMRCAGLANVMTTLALDVASEWPMADVDVVLAIDVLPVLAPAAIDQLFANAARVLVDSGTLALVTFLAASSAPPVPPAPAHLARWTVVVDPPTSAALGATAARHGLGFVESRPTSGERALLVFRRARRSVSSGTA